MHWMASVVARESAGVVDRRQCTAGQLEYNLGVIAPTVTPIWVVMGAWKIAPGPRLNRWQPDLPRRVLAARPILDGEDPLMGLASEMASVGLRLADRGGGVELERKLKTALDESRLLILGAQLLCGFQFQSVFQDLFAEVPRKASLFNAEAFYCRCLPSAALSRRR
jgi:hypothetical protein